MRQSCWRTLILKIFRKKFKPIRLPRKSGSVGAHRLEAVELQNCVLCNSEKVFSAPVSTYESRELREWQENSLISKWAFCEICGAFFQQIRPTDKCLESFYRESMYRTHGDNVEIHEGWWNYSRSQFERFVPWLDLCGVETHLQSRGSVLDYGCGIGGALQRFKRRGWDCYGLEIDETLAAFAADCHGLKMARSSKEIVGRKFDLIFAHHVYEHLARPNDLLDFAQRTLLPHGILLLVTPSWRFGNTPRVFEAFSLMDTVLVDHACLTLQAADRSLKVSAVLYQNTAPGTDWEVALVFHHGKQDTLPAPAGREEMERTLGNLRKTVANDQAMQRIILSPR